MCNSRLPTCHPVSLGKSKSNERRAGPVLISQIFYSCFYSNIVLNIYNDGAADSPSRIFVHLTGIDHEATLTAARPAHEPFPKHAMDTVENHGRHVNPRLVGDEVPEKPPRWARQETLVGDLHVIPIHRLFAVGAVAVAKYMQPGLDAPDFSE